MTNSLRRLTLKRGEARRVERGHLWVFSNEVERLDDGPRDEAAIYAADGRFLGSALLSPSALIRARVYSRQNEALDDALIRRRLATALDFRRRHHLAGSAYRLCFSEADWLPGLVVDIFGRWAVGQITTAGMDARRDAIISALRELLDLDGIYERSDVPSRRLENLPDAAGPLYGPPPGIIEITGEEHYLADIAAGQKTGHFLDMRFNRQWLAARADGRRVLELCCYTGAFAIGAALCGASSVIAVDSSEPALVLAAEGARRAGVEERCEFRRADAAAAAKALLADQRQFDLILVDPPPFARSKKDVKAALRAYRDLNMRAMRLLAPGAIFATATCSHHISRDEFLHALTLAARDAAADLRLIHEAGQAPDHPILLSTPESAYLKFFVFEKM